MASFYNRSQSDAFEKLQSGIRGEIEPLRRLGVVVNETMMKEELMRQGIRAVGGEYSEAQKVIGRFALIMANTAKAQGDLERTLSSPANVTRRIKEQWAEKQIEAAKTILPWYEKLTRAILNIENVMTAVSAKIVTLALEIKYALQDAFEWLMVKLKLKPEETLIQILAKMDARAVERTAALMPLMKALEENRDRMAAKVPGYANAQIDASRYVRDATEEEAADLLDLIKTQQQLAEEVEKRKRQMIGWTGLADSWKKAMAAGLQAQFGPEDERPFEERFKSRFRTQFENGRLNVSGLPGQNEMSRLISEYQSSKETDRAVLDTLREILRVNRLAFAPAGSEL